MTCLCSLGCGEVTAAAPESVEDSTRIASPDTPSFAAPMVVSRTDGPHARYDAPPAPEAADDVEDGDGEPAEPGDETVDEQPAEPEPPDETAFLQRSDMRAMWIWDETPGARELIENTDGARDELLAFAQAPHGRSDLALNRFYFEAREYEWVDPLQSLPPVVWDPLTEPGARPAMRQFLADAHAAGVAVEYLDGEALWLATDANAEVPKQICKDVVAFNLDAPTRAERFDGVHLDIEPHIVQSGPYAWQWWENRLPNGYNADWTARWKDILNDCRATFDDYERQTGHHLTLASDIGADLAYYNKPMLAFLNGPGTPVDYLGIMNYFDNRPNREGDPSFFYGMYDNNAITGGVVENLAFWDSTPLAFGVETGPAQIAPDEASFRQEGYRAMHRTLETVLGEYAGTQSLGVAVHHYGPHGYRSMAP